MIDLPLVGNLVSLLQKCRQKKDLWLTNLLQAFIYEHELESHAFLGNYVVPALVDCGSLPDAQWAFDKLPHRNEYSWSSLIWGYIMAGELHHAVWIYRNMCGDLIQPNSYTFVALLKACAGLKDVELSRSVHADVVKLGLDVESFVGSSMVDMYAKFGLLVEAQGVFDKLHVQDTVSWTALIAGYTEHGFGMEAQSCFDQMQLMGVSPDANTFACSLKACAIMDDIEKAAELHMELTMKGMESELFVGTTLVDMYAKCGLFVEAQVVFDQLPVQNIVSWTALMGGYADNGLHNKALNCLKHVQEGLYSDASAFLCSMKVCGITRALETGQKLHVKLVWSGLETDPSLGLALVDMYGRCCSLLEARNVFERLRVQDVTSWNTLIASYDEHGFSKEVLGCLKQMQIEGKPAVSITFIYGLKACAHIGGLDTGMEIHAEITKRGLDKELHVGTTLVDMYAKCSSVKEAQKSFDEIPDKNAFLWTALIGGYAENRLAHEALYWFEQMQLKSISPDANTFCSSLKACAAVEALEVAQNIHSELSKRQLDGDSFVVLTVIDAYLKCGLIPEAQHLFDKLPSREAVAWNILMTGYAERGYAEKVFLCLKRMQLEDISPDAATFSCSLKACSMERTIGTGQDLHAEITKIGLERELCVATTLVDMYAKCGSLADARELFDQLQSRDVVPWTALISGYAEKCLGNEVMSCLKQMQSEGVSPDANTFGCSLKACGIIGALEMGCILHGETTKRGFERELLVGNTLVDMYGGVGALAEGQYVFDKLPDHDVATWNAMIKAFGESQMGKMAIQCFEDMQQQGVKPDAVSFTSVLAACNKTSLFSAGLSYFKLMVEEHKIEPTLEHYACVIHLLARSGSIFEAESFFEALHCFPSSEILRTVLSSCDNFGEMKLGLRCFQQLVQLPDHFASARIQRMQGASCICNAKAAQLSKGFNRRG